MDRPRDESRMTTVTDTSGQRPTSTYDEGRAASWTDGLRKLFDTFGKYPALVDAVARGRLRTCE
jgi:hypothetical protein